MDPKQLRGLIDENKKKLGSGVSALVAVVDGRASIAVGVTDDLIPDQSAVDLVRVGVETLGGKGGGGRPGMAQGGGPAAARTEGRPGGERCDRTGRYWVSTYYDKNNKKSRLT